MSSVESIDVSQYTSAMYPIVYDSMDPVKAIGSYENERGQNAAAYTRTTPKVDLNNYYSNVAPPESYTDLGRGLINAERQLNEAVSDAVQNGMSIQNAVNIRMAVTAYQANAEVLKSTFELTV